LGQAAGKKDIDDGLMGLSATLFPCQLATPRHDSSQSEQTDAAGLNGQHVRTADDLAAAHRMFET
jgi:hypothetical protein